MADALTHETTRTLWPFLKSEGFTKVTSRKFVRQKNGVFQQLCVDAGGSAGKKNTCVVLWASLPFGPVIGYLDPHGFRMSNGRGWNMSTPESAAHCMLQVIKALQANELAKLDSISSVERLIGLLELRPDQGWHSTYSLLHKKWLDKDPEALAIERANRATLKLV